jgi:hypothetical protein
MAAGSNLLSEGMDDVLSSVIREAGEDLLMVDPAVETIEHLVAVASDSGDGREAPNVRLLADEGVLKDVMDDFIVASNAADLVEDGVLSMRTLDDGAENALVITAEAVMALVTAGDRVAALSTSDEAFVAAAAETYGAQFEAAAPFNLRTPPLSRVRETLEGDIGGATRADFDAVLASLETARGDGEGLDEVTISLLVAARNEVLLYDISKWGEDVGIASKATFSRTKTRLEGGGLIDTEKVPIDVGRPRLRLKLGDDRLREADAAELAAVAVELLE